MCDLPRQTWLAETPNIQITTHGGGERGGKGRREYEKRKKELGKGERKKRKYYKQ